MADDVRNSIFIKADDHRQIEPLVAIMEDKENLGLFGQVAPLPEELQKKRSFDEAVYAWQKENWGPTSSSTYDLRGVWMDDAETKALISFETRWSGAVGIARNLSLKIPGAHVYIEYASENSDHTGFVLFRNGETLLEKKHVTTLNTTFWAGVENSVMKRAEDAIGSSGKDPTRDMLVESFTSHVVCAACALRAGLQQTGLEDEKTFNALEEILEICSRLSSKPVQDNID